MFTIHVPPEHTALIKGPAEIICQEECQIFGGRFKHVVVPPHKQYPVLGPAVLKTSAAQIALVPEATIPPEWSQRLQGVVALVGPTDSGKSSLATYLTNIHTSSGMRICVVNADVGQSDIGPPGFVAYSCTSSPIPHIAELEPQDAYYVGSTNLQGMEELLVAGVVKCLRKAMAQYPHLVIINTPGWTTGRGLQLLTAIIDATEAQAINIGQKITPGPVLPKPKYVLPRGPEERKALRNYAYQRHMAPLKKKAEGIHITNCRWDKALECPWGRYIPSDVEQPEKKGRDYLVPPTYLKHIMAALYKQGRLVGYGIVEKFEPPTIYVTTEDFDEVRLGKIRLDPHTIQELEPLP